MTYDDIRRVLWESKSVRVTLVDDTVIAGDVIAIANGYREPGWVKLAPDALASATVQFDFIKNIEALS